MSRPGPHREGEEPKPMMHERGKSDSAIGAVKPANKAERSAAELVEQRAGTKRNADQQSTRRAQGLAAVEACFTITPEQGNTNNGAIDWTFNPQAADLR